MHPLSPSHSLSLHNLRPSQVSNRTLRPSPAWNAGGTSPQPPPATVVAARLERPFLLFGPDGAPQLAFFAMGTKHSKRSALPDVPETAAIAVSLGPLRAA